MLVGGGEGPIPCRTYVARRVGVGVGVGVWVRVWVRV